MKPSIRKRIYRVAAAVIAALASYGIVTAEDGEKILTGIEAAMAIGPLLLAAKNVPEDE